MARSVFAMAVLLMLATTTGAAPPNIVLIVGDDQAWTDYGFMSHAHIQTPYLDKLAAEAMVFKRGYVPSSLCRASLATMITGLYPHQHKITSNDPPIPKGLSKESMQAVCVMLKGDRPSRFGGLRCPRQ